MPKKKQGSNQPPIPLEMPADNTRLHTFDDARKIARRVLPRVIFDYQDGAAGTETGEGLNRQLIREMRLQSRVLRNVTERRVDVEILNQHSALPFGIAPMGMCNLARPETDLSFARLSAKYGMPTCVSTAASTSLEKMAETSEGNAWFQLYSAGDHETDMILVERARMAGYKTLMLTVDVPQVARRPRELRHGFKTPFRIGPKLFFDFATHPVWSLSTLAKGAPVLANFEGSGMSFSRHGSRAGADWGFLKGLRDTWKGNLVVKGVLSVEDAIEIKKMGIDAIQISSHGGRQLDSVVPPIQVLPQMRAALGPDYPLLYDSGMRSGEDIVKAYASGASFVMLGRCFLFASAAEGEAGVHNMALSLAAEVSITLAQVGLLSVSDIDENIIVPMH